MKYQRCNNVKVFGKVDTLLLIFVAGCFAACYQPATETVHQRRTRLRLLEFYETMKLIYFQSKRLQNRRPVFKNALLGTRDAVKLDFSVRHLSR